jgi:hypothetical protein
LRHAQRFDAEEPVEQALDIGIIGGNMVTIAGQPLQLRVVLRAFSC